MNKYIQYLSEIQLLLGDGSRKLPLIVSFFLLSSLIDLAGISLIVPYVALIVDPDGFIQGDLYKYLTYFRLPVDTNQMLISISFGLLGVFVFKAGVAIFINKIILSFSYKQGVKLSSHLMRSYQNLPYEEYLRRNSSEYVFLIQALAGQFSSILQSLLRLTSEVIVGSAIIILLAWTNGPALALLAIILGGGMYFYDHFFRRNIQKYGVLSNQYSTRMIQGIHEGIEGLKEIRILGHQEYFHSFVKENAKKAAEVRVKSSVISMAPRYLLEMLLIIFIVSLVLASFIFNYKVDLLLPTLSMFGIASIRLLPSATQIIAGITHVRFSRNAINLLYKDLKYIDKVAQDTPIKSIIQTQEEFNNLTLKNLDFSYENSNRLALNNISLKICAGESIGLIGASGSGKTTLVDMILGLLKHQDNELFYNNRPLNKYLSKWHSQVAYLPQQVFLIDASLKCNVALGLGEKSIDMDKLDDALRKAQLSELVSELPHGVDTMLGERGVRISGGQRQRVALARAFYHGRSVLIMDEATSALDTETESEIVNEIERLKGDITMIVIAHRLTTVQHCDRIYRLEKGVIVEEGNFQKVAQSSKQSVEVDT